MSGLQLCCIGRVMRLAGRTKCVLGKRKAKRYEKWFVMKLGDFESQHCSVGVRMSERNSF